MEETAVIVKKKLGKIPKILIGIFVFFILFFCYMHFIEPKIIVTHEYAIINELIPDSFNGFKIAHFSDIHFGRTTNEKEVKKMVSKIQETKPDIVVFTGDLFDNYITLSDDNKKFLQEELSKITANVGKYAIQGDSDYLDIDAYQKIMNSAGFTILENQNVPIYFESNTPIYLSGISSITKGQQDYIKALEKKEEGKFYQILLCHEPIAFSEIKNKTSLTLAGHSLGGLVRIPYLGGIIRKENVSGYQTGKYIVNSSTLYVSNGIGSEDISLRLGNLPSINLYRLYNY